MTEHYHPIKYKNIFNDGCEEFSFVHVIENNRHKIGFALKDSNGESHAEIFELGIEDGFFNGDSEPVGGGIFNAKNGEFVRASFNYGIPEPEIIEHIDRKLPSIIDC